MSFSSPATLCHCCWQCHFCFGMLTQVHCFTMVQKNPLKIIQMNISKPNHCNDICYCFMPIMSDKFGLITLFLMGENTFYLRIVYYGQHLILIGLKHILPITAFDRRKYSVKIALIDCDYSLVQVQTIDIVQLYIHCPVQYVIIINLYLLHFWYNHWVKFLPQNKAVVGSWVEAVQANGIRKLQ